MKNNKNDIYKLDLINKSKLIEIFNDLKSDMKYVKDNPNYQEYLNKELEYLNGWCDIIICAINRHDSLIEKLEQQEKENAEYKEILRIIKEKNVNIGLVNVLGSVEQYNQTYVYDNMLNVKWCLTEAEFELLKHYFEKNIQKQ